MSIVRLFDNETCIYIVFKCKNRALKVKKNKTKNEYKSRMDVPEEATTGKKKSRKRTNKIWLIDQKFVSSVEAIKYVKNQQE